MDFMELRNVMIFSRQEETNIQIALSNYLKLKYPGVLFTIAPSGMKLSAFTAKMIKAMGYRAGSPDMMIFEPMFFLGKLYHGLFLEIKTEKGIISSNQKEFLELLDKRGYKTYVCFGYQAGIQAIENYLGVKQPAAP